MSYEVIVLAICTWYADAHQGKTMANGEPFDMHNYTCATWLYPLGTELIVKYGNNSVIVLVTDRCDKKTEIDLSYAAFYKICNPDLGRMQAQVIFRLSDQTAEWKSKF